ncbi:MAG: NUDIX domain-containing protein [Bacteroidetes bacterium]|nr:NUDIX domain-containing protein [Bacteroidota bacterium]
MYKVFIDNTPLIIGTDLPEDTKNAVVIHSNHTKTFREALFAWTDKVKNFNPVYIITSHPESTFAKLFEAFDFIEAAGGIVKKENRFLFIKRNGFWDIPKGKLDAGESPAIGAVREIEEECGITNPIVSHLITTTYHTYKLKDRPTIKRTYWYAMEYLGDEILKGQIDEGITKVKWFKADDLFKVKENTFASILDVMHEYFEKEGIEID